MEKIEAKKEYALLDLLKFIACFLIVGSHCLPLFKSNINLNYFYGQWFFRFCVPVFIISTGYFFSLMSCEKRNKYIKRLIYLYIIATIVYFPFTLAPTQPLTYKIRDLILGYHHLWYISAIISSLFLFNLLCKKIEALKTRHLIVIILLLISIGAFLDEYYKIFDIASIRNFGLFFEKYINGGRNFLFFAFPLLLIGYLINKHKNHFNLKICLLLVPLSFVLSFLESCILRKYIGYYVSADITFVNYIPAALLVFVTTNAKINVNFNSRFIRKVSDSIYLIHPYIIYYFREKQLIYNMKLFIYSYMASLFISSIFIYIFSKIKKPSK